MAQPTPTKFLSTSDHAFLLAIALSFRNTSQGTKAYDVLRLLDQRIECLGVDEVAANFGLSEEDGERLRSMASWLRHYVTTPGLALADPSSGPSH